MASELDWKQHDERLGKVLSGYFGSPEVRGKMGEGRSAGMAWHSVNGDIERKHTTGVFVGKPRRPGEAPVLCVYVDSRMRAVDFRANREVYLARLWAAGYSFSDVRFLENRRPVAKKAAEKGAAPATARASRQMEPLSAEEQSQVDSACAGLPPKLRERLSKAMSASMRRQKSE